MHIFSGDKILVQAYDSPEHDFISLSGIRDYSAFKSLEGALITRLYFHGGYIKSAKAKFTFDEGLYIAHDFHDFQSSYQDYLHNKNKPANLSLDIKDFYIRKSGR